MKYCLIFILLVIPLSASAQYLNQAAEESRLRDLYSQFRCPTCQGLSVKDSQAGFSVQIREKIEEMVKQNKSDDEIKAFFVKRYGDWILTAPPKEGFNLVLWVGPFLLVLIAGIFTAKTVLISTKKLNVLQEADSDPLTEQELKIVEKDFQRFKNS